MASWWMWQHDFKFSDLKNAMILLSKSLLRGPPKSVFSLGPHNSMKQPCSSVLQSSGVEKRSAFSATQHFCWHWRTGLCSGGMLSVCLLMGVRLRQIKSLYFAFVFVFSFFLVCHVHLVCSIFLYVLLFPHAEWWRDLLPKKRKPCSKLHESIWIGFPLAFYAIMNLPIIGPTFI